MTGVIEEAAASLVKEFLSRKGLKRTLVCIEEELPRTDSSINNRTDLRRILHLQALYKKNKSQEFPLKSLLEIIVKQHIDAKGDARSVNMDVGFPTHNKLSSQAKSTCPTKSQKPSIGSSSSKMELDSQQLPFSQDSDCNNYKTVLSSEPTKFTEISKIRNNRILRGMMAGPIASSSLVCNKKRQTQRFCGPNLTQEKNCAFNFVSPMTGQSYSMEALKMERSIQLPFQKEYTKQHEQEKVRNSSLQVEVTDTNGTHIFEKTQAGLKQRETSERKSLDNSQTLKAISLSPKADDLHITGMLLDDINDEEGLCELSWATSLSCAVQSSVETQPMDQHTAIILKELLFGSSMNCFNEEWKAQSFTFSDIPELRYGIVQKKGGPCGVLASVQAYVLQKLLFEETRAGLEYQSLQPSNVTRTQHLLKAIAEILWRAGDGRRAAVAISSGRKHFIPSGRYKSDGILEMIVFYTVKNLEDLKLLLEQHIKQFESGPSGCILLTISAILSRSVEMVRADFDVPTSSLIGVHGYCTQELVNLLLCGRAVSNVFNDNIKLSSGNGDIILLKGIKSCSDIGLLSLFEHYNICKVGTYLKTPKFPIWVVCSESHFSVLFCKELVNDCSMETQFDLYYYDGLANQLEEIRLTISTAISRNRSECVDNDLIPPLEHCIRTKWKDATVNWNKTEPIL